MVIRFLGNRKTRHSELQPKISHRRLSRLGSILEYDNKTSKKEPLGSLCHHITPVPAPRDSIDSAAEPVNS